MEITLYENFIDNADMAGSYFCNIHPNHVAD